MVPVKFKTAYHKLVRLRCNVAVELCDLRVEGVLRCLAIEYHVYRSNHRHHCRGCHGISPGLRGIVRIHDPEEIIVIALESDCTRIYQSGAEYTPVWQDKSLKNLPWTLGSCVAWRINCSDWPVNSSGAPCPVATTRSAVPRITPQACLRST